MSKVRKFLTILALAGTILGQAACTAIDPNNLPSPDWPKLEETVHTVDAETMGVECAKAGVGGFLAIPLACTVISFEQMTCTTWLVWEAQREHEHQHCLGYDHYGSNALHEAWTDWKGTQWKSALTSSGKRTDDR